VTDLVTRSAVDGGVIPGIDRWDIDPALDTFVNPTANV
jgi:hypothetical protein